MSNAWIKTENHKEYMSADSKWRIFKSGSEWNVQHRIPDRWNKKNKMYEICGYVQTLSMAKKLVEDLQKHISECTEWRIQG